MVLFLYVLMMMNLNKDSEPGKSWMVQIAAALASGLLLLVITASVKGADSLPVKSNVSTSIGLLENLGKTLFNEFMLPFEVSSSFSLGIWPILMGATMVIQQKLSPPPADPTQAKILKFMPYGLTIVLAAFPAGLVIYWTWSNSLSILQQIYINRKYKK